MGDEEKIQSREVPRQIRRDFITLNWKRYITSVLETFTIESRRLMSSDQNNYQCPDSALAEKVVPAVVSEEGGQLPIYASDEAAGADVHACLSEEVVLNPGERKLISTGLKFEIPKGYEIQIRPRSGLALKQGVTVLNTPGTIDSDYRGTVGIVLINLGEHPFSITPGMRIAQIVLAPVCRAKFVEREALATTSRGEGGFGHTGIH